MEFLYKLYDTEYFGIGLFIVIAVLIFLFLLILFFGKKDEKNRKLEETKKLELMKENDTKEVNDDLTSEEIPVIEQPTLDIEKTNENSDISMDNTTINPVENEVKGIEIPTLVEESVKEEVVPTEEIKVGNNNAFENLENDSNSSINSLNLDELFQTNNISEPIEEIKEPVVEIKEPTEEVKEVFEKPSLKVEAPFSSVYTNDEIIKPSVPEIKEEVVSNSFELPKKVEMPKLNEVKEEIKEIPEEKAKEVEPVSDFDSLFGNIEPEIFNIDK